MDRTPARALRPTLAMLVTAVLAATSACNVTANGLGSPPGASTSANRNPIIQTFTANPSQTNAKGQPITFQVAAYDPDPLQYTWTATGGTLSTTTGTAVVWTPPATAGVHTVIVTILNGRGGSVTGSLNVTVLADGTSQVATPITTPGAPAPSAAAPSTGGPSAAPSVAPPATSGPSTAPSVAPSGTGSAIPGFIPMVRINVQPELHFAPSPEISQAPKTLASASPSPPVASATPHDFYVLRVHAQRDGRNAPGGDYALFAFEEYIFGGGSLATGFGDEQGDVWFMNVPRGVNLRLALMANNQIQDYFMRFDQPGPWQVDIDVTPPTPPPLPGPLGDAASKLPRL